MLRTKIRQQSKRKNKDKPRSDCIILSHQYNPIICISKFINYNQITSFIQQKKFKKFIKTNQFALSIKNILGNELSNFDFNNTHNQLILAILLLEKKDDLNNFLNDWVEDNHFYKCVCPMCSLAHFFKDNLKLSYVESFVSSWIIVDDERFNDYSCIYKILNKYKYVNIKKSIVYDKIVENDMWFNMNKNSIIRIKLTFEKYTTTTYKIRNFIKCNEITQTCSRLPPEIIDIIIKFIFKTN
jgi:hypothetical protein